MNRVQIEISLGLVFMLLSSFFLVNYATREEDRMAELARAEQAQSIEVGAALFENNCIGCHGKQGQGIQGLCPPLNDKHFFTDRLKEVGWGGTLEDYIIATVSSGRLVSTRPETYPGGGKPAMPSWSDRYGGPLRDDQIHDIAQFILNWKSTAMNQVVLATVEVPGTTSNDPVERGKALYTSGACVACHTLGSLSAGQVGPNLTHIGSEAATLVPGQSAEDFLKESIIKPNAYIAKNCPTGPCQPNIMPQNFGDQYNEQQISDLVAFLLAQK